MQATSKAIILARVSSKAQEDEGYSLDSQVKLMRNYCKSKKLVIVEEFKIAETASKDQRRKIYRNMVTYITKRRIHNIVVEKTDRLTRNFKDAVTIDAWLEGDERRMLHMVKESLLLHKNARSDAKFMWNIYLSVAKKYTDNLREEAMKGWAEKLAQGWLPSPPPPGYVTVTEQGKRIHVPDPATAKLIQLAFELYCQPDQTVRTIAEKMTELGIVSSRGKPLSKSYVHDRVLDNPFYVGVNRFDGKDYPGAQEPIINMELFGAVQKKLHNGRPSKYRRHNPIFKGLIQCLNCNSMVTWQVQKGRFYGACQRVSGACRDTPMLREDRVEVTVIRALEGISDPYGEVLKKLEVALQIEQPQNINAYREKMIGTIQRQIARLNKMEDMLYEDKLAGLITPERYSVKRQQIANEMVAAQERLEKLYEVQGMQNPVEPEPESHNPIVNLYLKSSVNQRRIIIASLFDGLGADGEAVILYPRRHSKS